MLRHPFRPTNLSGTFGIFCLTFLCGLICGSCATADEGISLNEAKSFHTRYATYYDGPEVAGLPLENINGDPSHCCSFMYGTCTPPPAEGGCAPPLEIQVFSTCKRWFRGIAGRRHAHIYNFRGAKTIANDPPESYTPEIFTGRTTVVFWGESWKIVKAAERQLREIHQSKPQALPPPVHGSLWGRLPCQRKHRLG